MKNYHLSEQELVELRAAHGGARNSREAYRLNAVILLGSGWGPAEVASALLMDDDTVRHHFKRYKQGGLPALTRKHYIGSEALLSGEELAELDKHLEQHLHLSAASVARWGKERFGVYYTDSGMTALRHRMGYRNINGAIDVETMHAVIRDDDTIGAASTIALFSQIETAYPKAATITVFCDNARYYRSKAVRDYLDHSRIDLQFFPRTRRI